MFFRVIYSSAVFTAIALISACSGDQAQKRQEANQYLRTTNTVIPADSEIISFPTPPQINADSRQFNTDRNAYFGDLHVHTALSFDAAGFGTTATPADAYRYAQGEAILHPSGFEVQLAQPLDFYAVTDHAQMLGLIGEAADTGTTFSDYELSESYHGINDSVDGGLFDIAREILFSIIFAVMLWPTYSMEPSAVMLLTVSANPRGSKPFMRQTKLIGLVSSPPLLPMNTHPLPRNQGTFTAM